MIPLSRTAHCAIWGCGAEKGHRHFLRWESSIPGWTLLGHAADRESEDSTVRSEDEGGNNEGCWRPQVIPIEFEKMSIRLAGYPDDLPMTWGSLMNC